MKRFCFALLALAAEAAAGTAAAQSATPVDVAPSQPASQPASQPTRIVLVTGPELEDLANRFAAELTSLHFEVVRAAAAVEPQPANALEDLAREQQARAAVRVSAVEGALDLWLVNPRTHEAVYRRIVAERDPAVAVLRSLEILRGSLIDLRALAPKPVVAAAAAKAAPSPPSTLSQPTPAPHAVWWGIGPAATLIDTRRAPAAGAQTGVHFAVLPQVWLHAEALVPLDEWTVNGEGGRVRAWAGAFALGGSIAPWAERTFTPTLGLGVAALALHTRGEATDGFRGTSDLNVVAFGHGRLDAALRLLARLRVRAQILAGFAAPRPVLLFAEARNTTWVNPLISGALSLELRLN